MNTAVAFAHFLRARDLGTDRVIVAAHHAVRLVGQPLSCVWCGPGTVLYPCQTLRLVAVAYAGEPGYRDEWRPFGEGHESEDCWRGHDR